MMTNVLELSKHGFYVTFEGFPQDSLVVSYPHT